MSEVPHDKAAVMFYRKQHGFSWTQADLMHKEVFFSL